MWSRKQEAETDRHSPKEAMLLAAKMEEEGANKPRNEGTAGVLGKASGASSQSLWEEPIPQHRTSAPFGILASKL